MDNEDCLGQISIADCNFNVPRSLDSNAISKCYNSKSLFATVVVRCCLSISSYSGMCRGIGAAKGTLLPDG